MPTLARISVRDAGHVVLDEAASLVNEAMIDFFRKAMVVQGKLGL